MSNIIKFFMKDIDRMLFPEKEEIPEILKKKIVPTPKSVEDAWRIDMENIGADLRSAMNKVSPLSLK